MMVDVVVGYLHCWGWMSVIAAITNSKQTFHFIASLAHKSYQLSIGRSFLIRYSPHPVLHTVTVGGQHSSLLHFIHWFIIVMGVVGSVTGHCVPNEECVTRESFIRNRIIITTGIHILLRCGDYIYILYTHSLVYRRYSFSPPPPPPAIALRILNVTCLICEIFIRTPLSTVL